ncbi:adenosine receptor A2a-like [Orbicella faveolata]|uniref:adenosine receptor A2a-like n=1 Tax=Orbicella faveolata TaxID=48498 RepID=UPI0009E5EF7B|nr:adenosine receptor A2a-like [Orbicella faveolata]
MQTIMHNSTIIIALSFAAIIESLIIIVGNIFTIFVFWKNRSRLKRTSFLLINLTVADLFVGFTEPIASGPFDIAGHLEETSVNIARNTNISTAFQVTFSFTSVFFLALISLERAYALIWPFRHRVASTKGYIYSAIFAWVAGLSAGTLALLAVYNILDFFHWIAAFGFVLVLCLVTICVSYLAIRTRLNCRVPVINGPHNRQNEQQQNAKLARTLFLVITASLLFWVPSIVVYCIHYRCSKCLPLLVFRSCNLFRLANSLVNPIIYSFRIPMFRETFKRVKLCKQSKKYTINLYTP